MALETLVIKNKLIEAFDSKISNFEQDKDMFTFETSPESIKKILRFLKEDETLCFNFLTDVCGVHYPNSEIDKQFVVVYHMHSWYNNVRLRIKCFLNGYNPEIDTVSDLFKSANWQERETYDFFGISFKGHPQLKRILNMDEMVSFPMRKEYPLEDSGRTDKDDRFFGRTPENQ